MSILFLRGNKGLYLEVYNLLWQRLRIYRNNYRRKQISSPQAETVTYISGRV